MWGAAGPGAACAVPAPQGWCCVDAWTLIFAQFAHYLKRSFTWLLASVRELAGFLPESTASIAGFMMPSTFAALSAMGNRNVVPSLTWVVKAETSVPLALKALAALSEELVMAGKTTALDATTSWQAAEPRYSTHLTDAAGFLVPAQTESARPLNMLARLPFGPLGVGANAVSTPL